MEKNRGSLLLECLLVISIASVLLVSSLVGLRQWVRHRQEVHEGNRISALLSRARLLAMQRGEAVLICGSSTGRYCDKAWSRGCLFESKQGERLLYRRLRLPELAWHGGSVGREPGLVFSPKGELSSSPGHFSWREHDHEDRVFVALSGKIRFFL